MSRDPLEGVRPSDTARPTSTFSPPVSPGPAVSSGSPVSHGSPTRGGGAKIVIFVVIGICIALGTISAMFLGNHPPQTTMSRPTSTPAMVPTPVPEATKTGEADLVIRQSPRHSPDGSPETPPANEMTTIPPKPNP